MKDRFFFSCLLAICLQIFPGYSEEAFKVVVLGCGGGPIENNLSGYLVAPHQSTDYIALDAGSFLEDFHRQQKRELR